MSPSSKYIAELSPREKRALLVRLLRKKAKASQAKPRPGPERSGVLGQLGVNVADLSPRAVLDPTIGVDAAAVAPPAEPAHILLTGATGFLGAFLLAELLDRTKAGIYCLVRCSDVEEGRSRVLRNLESYVSGSRHPRSRIIPIPGDMSKPLLGLSDEGFERLANRIETIYHSGAWVNWIYPYERLEAANVLGTQEILRLASRAKVKPLHYVSTISVFPLFSDAGAAVIYEQDDLDHGGVLYGGYMQTKWVAERLVTAARSRGMPVAIYRPGLIVGHSLTGAWNTEDVTSKLVKSFVELGYAPELEAATDMTPVDYVSRAIVHLSRLPDSLGRVFHLTNTESVHARDLVNWIRAFGYPIESVSYERWRAELVERATRPRNEATHSLAPIFAIRLSDDAQQAEARQEDTADGLGILFLSQYARTSVRFDCQNAQDSLANTAIVCPRVDGELFDTYLSRFVHSGFLEAPTAERAPKPS